MAAADAEHVREQRENRQIKENLKKVPLTYDQVFEKLQREKAMQSLYNNKQMLRREKALVQAKLRRAHLMLIRPDGKFMQYFDFVQLTALAYTAVVTPYEIAYASSSASVVLLVTNTLVLTAFISQIVVTFFLPFQEPIWRGGCWVRNHRRIAERYLRSWFAFDFISCLPIDEMLIALMSSAGSSAGDAAETNSINTDASASALDALRMVRLFRLIKLGRLLAASRIVERISVRFENVITISYTLRTTMFWMLVLLVTIHWFCCMWGLLALMQGSQRDLAAIASLGDRCAGSWPSPDVQPNLPPGSCLNQCEIDALAEARNVLPMFLQEQESWTCRAMADGMLPPNLVESGSSAYFYILHLEGQLWEPKRTDEFIMTFLVGVRASNPAHVTGVTHVSRM